MSNHSPLTIAAIETIPFHLPMYGALQWGKSSSFATVSHIAVRVVLSDGSEGWAEAPPRPTIYGETIHSIPAVIRDELAPRVIGLKVWPEELPSPGALWTMPTLRRIQSRLHEIKNNHTAKAAIDMALHSALAQHRGIHLLDHLLDGEQRTLDRLRVSYILGIGDRDTVLEEAKRVVAQGVRMLKVKVGRSWDEDIARIHDLQTELGPSVDLYADANECMDAREAAAKLEFLASLGLHYCEEALPVEQIAERATLREAQCIPLIADDSTFTLRDLQREIAFDTFDILNIKTARTGFTESATMLALARRAEKGVMIGSQASAGLGTLHAALFAALPGIAYPSELSFPLKLRADILRQPLPIVDGYLRVDDLLTAQFDPSALTASTVGAWPQQPRWSAPHLSVPLPLSFAKDVAMSFPAPTPEPPVEPASSPETGPASIPTSGPIAITGPLGIAELLDRTFRALRARFGVLVLSASIVLVPLGVITALISGRFMTGYFELLEFSFIDPEQTEVAMEQFFGNAVGYFGAIVFMGILSLVGTTLVTLMSMHHIQRFLHGETSTLADGWRVAIRRLLPMIGMQIMQFVAIGAVTVVVAIGVSLILVVVALIFGGAIAALGNETMGIILGIGMVIIFVVGYLLLIVLMLAPTVIFMGRWIASGPSLLIENEGPVSSLQRSWALTKGRAWRSILYIFLLTLFSFIVIGLPVAAMQWIAMLAMPSQIAAVAIISTIVSYILNLFYQPFYATGVVLFYYDLRVRAEAYNVSLRVAALEAELAPDAPPA